jgi:hypothetical protein
VVKDLEKRIQEYQQNCSEKRKELADEEVKLVSCKQQVMSINTER